MKSRNLHFSTSVTMGGSGGVMRSKLFGVLYAMNIIMQALFDLAAPAALLFFIAWMLVKRVGAPEWIYAIAIPVGIIIGLYSMVRFIISATTALSRLEEQNKRDKDQKNKRNNG